MKNQRIFSANVGDSSVGNAGPDAIEQDIDNLLANDQELLGQINNLDAQVVSQKVSVTSTDDATSVTNAPLKTAGGLAVAKKTYLGDALIHKNTGLVRSTGKNFEFIFTEQQAAKILTGEQLRLRFTVLAGATFMFNLNFYGGSHTSNANRSMVISKLITFGMTYSNTLRDTVSSLLLNSQIIDAEAYVSAVGSDNQVDLILKHPASHTYSIDYWTLQLNVISNAATFTFNNIIVENIP